MDTSSSKQVLAILVDALRYDIVSEESTPFISQLARNGRMLPLKPVLGYSDSIRATIFTGARPDRHGYWMSYCHSPGTSPLKGFRKLGFVDYLPSDFLRRGIKFFLSSTVMKPIGKARGYNELHLHNIPFHVISKFDMTLKTDMTSPHVFEGYSTIFDVLRDRGKEFAYFDSSKLKGDLLTEINKLDGGTSFVFVYLHYVDEASHWFGLDSTEFRRAVRFVDSLVKRIVFSVNQRLPGLTATMVFSDHGMAEERNRIDLSSLARLEGFGRDFIFALDATMVRVWYYNPVKVRKLRTAIARICGARLLSQEERKNLGIAFENRLYGDDIFLLEEGTIIFPNFHSYVRPKAMHAYHPSYQKQRGIFILQTRNGLPTLSQPTAEHVELVDIGPTILSLMNIDIPGTFEGKSWA